VTRLWVESSSFCDTV